MTFFCKYEINLPRECTVWMDNWRLPSRSKTSKNNPGFQLYPDDVTGTDQQQRSKVSGEKRSRLIDKVSSIFFSKSQIKAELEPI